MAVSMGGIGSGDYMPLIQDTQGKNYENIIGNSDNTDESMLEACKEFEKYMIEQIYKGMEKTIDRAEEKSEYEEYFGEMRISQYADSVMEQGGIGLARQLYESMKRNMGTPVITEEPVESNDIQTD